jgi:predicted small lipoprotein YifL
VELTAFRMKSLVMSFSRILFLVGFAVFLQACGQTGPLYMPGTPAPVHVPDEHPEDEI